MKNNQLNALHHCKFNINFHLVLITKYRKKCINQAVLRDLASIFERLCETWDVDLQEFNGKTDHVHLLVSSTPRIAPSKFVNNLKTVSSRLIRRDHKKHLNQFFSKPVLWSRSYCLVSCGGAPLDVIKKYIENQDGTS